MAKKEFLGVELSTWGGVGLATAAAYLILPKITAAFNAVNSEPDSVTSSACADQATAYANEMQGKQGWFGDLVTRDSVQWQRWYDDEYTRCS